MKQVKIFFIGSLIYGAFALYAYDYKVAKKARQLQKEKRYEEAIAVFETLSDKTKNDYDDQRYMLAAINIAVRFLKNNKKAIQLAERIKNPERRAFVLMSLYKPDVVIEKYKDTDFMAWPEDVRPAAYKNRGCAYSSLKKYENALSDLEKAFTTPGGRPTVKGVAAKTAGDIYLYNIKNEAKAEEMYRNALSVTKAGYSWRNTSLVRLSELLLKNKKNKEALAIYKYTDIKKIRNSHSRSILARAYSKVLAANGENLKALEQLNIALQAAAGKPELKKQIQEEIDKITEDML